MNRAETIVTALLETDDSLKDFILAQAREDAPSTELVDFGVAIGTSSGYEIKENLRELGLDPDGHDVWDQLMTDISRLERNAEVILRDHGLGLRLEGHSDDEIVGTAWVEPGSAAWGWLMRLTDYDPAADVVWDTGSGSIWQFERGIRSTFYEGVSELGQRVLDFSISLFDLERLQAAIADHSRLVRND